MPRPPGSVGAMFILWREKSRLCYRRGGTVDGREAWWSRGVWKTGLGTANVNAPCEAWWRGGSAGAMGAAEICRLLRVSYGAHGTGTPSCRPVRTKRHACSCSMNCKMQLRSIQAAEAGRSQSNSAGRLRRKRYAGKQAGES